MIRNCYISDSARIAKNCSIAAATLLVMIAHDIRIIIQSAVKQSLYRSISVAGDAAVQCNACIRKGSLGIVADTTACS